MEYFISTRVNENSTRCIYEGFLVLKNYREKEIVGKWGLSRCEKEKGDCPDVEEYLHYYKYKDSAVGIGIE